MPQVQQKQYACLHGSSHNFLYPILMTPTACCMQGTRPLGIQLRCSQSHLLGQMLQERPGGSTGGLSRIWDEHDSTAEYTQFESSALHTRAGCSFGRDRVRSGVPSLCSTKSCTLQICLTSRGEVPDMCSY